MLVLFTLSIQLHKQTHHSSCFKQTKPVECEHTLNDLKIYNNNNKSECVCVCVQRSLTTGSCVPI